MLTFEQRQLLEKYAGRDQAYPPNSFRQALAAALTDLDQARADLAALEGVVRDVANDHFSGAAFGAAGERTELLALLNRERDGLRRFQDVLVRSGIAGQREADNLQATVLRLERLIAAVAGRGPARDLLPMERLERENEQLRRALAVVVPTDAPDPIVELTRLSGQAALAQALRAYEPDPQPQPLDLQRLAQDLARLPLSEIRRLQTELTERRAAHTHHYTSTGQARCGADADGVQLRLSLENVTCPDCQAYED